MHAMVGPKAGSRHQISEQKSESAVCLTPGFSPGKMQIPELTGFSRKAGRSQNREIFGLAGITYAGLRINFCQLLG